MKNLLSVQKNRSHPKFLFQSSGIDLSTSNKEIAIPQSLKTCVANGKYFSISKRFENKEDPKAKAETIKMQNTLKDKGIYDKTELELKNKNSDFYKSLKTDRCTGNFQSSLQYFEKKGNTLDTNADGDYGHSTRLAVACLQFFSRGAEEVDGAFGIETLADLDKYNAKNNIIDDSKNALNALLGKNKKTDQYDIATGQKTTPTDPETYLPAQRHIINKEKQIKDSDSDSQKKKSPVIEKNEDQHKSKFFTEIENIKQSKETSAKKIKALKELAKNTKISLNESETEFYNKAIVEQQNAQIAEDQENEKIDLEKRKNALLEEFSKIKDIDWNDEDWINISNGGDLEVDINIDGGDDWNGKDEKFIYGHQEKHGFSAKEAYDVLKNNKLYFTLNSFPKTIKDQYKKSSTFDEDVKTNFVKFAPLFEERSGYDVSDPDVWNGDSNIIISKNNEPVLKLYRKPNGKFYAFNEGKWNSKLDLRENGAIQVSFQRAQKYLDEIDKAFDGK